MTGVRLLDSIDAKRPDCVYREGFNIRHTPQHKNGSGVDQIELNALPDDYDNRGHTLGEGDPGELSLVLWPRSREVGH